MNAVPAEPGHRQTRKALAAILPAGVCWGFAVPLIDWTLPDDANSALFTLVAKTVSAAAVAALLAVTRTRLPDPPGRADMRRWASTMTMSLRVDATGRAEMRRQRSLAGRTLMPAGLVLAGSFDVLFVAWATQLTEASAVSALSETWPLLTVVHLAVLNRHDRRDCLRMGPTVAVPAVAMTIGVVLLVGGVSGLDGQGVGTVIAGGAVTMGAAAAFSLSVVLSVLHGKLMMHHHRPDPAHQSPALLAWWILCSFVVTRLIGLPAITVFVAISGGFADPVGPALLAGATAVGILAATQGSLGRLGNSFVAPPAVNLGYYAAPVVAQTLLIAAGVDVAHFGVFLAGVTLLVAANAAVGLAAARQPAEAHSASDDHDGWRPAGTAAPRPQPPTAR